MSSERLTYLAFDDPRARKGAAVHIEAFAQALAREYGGLDLITPAASTQTTLELWPGVDHYGFAATGRSLVERVATFRTQMLAWFGTRHTPVVHVRSIYEGYPLARRKERLCDRFVMEVNGLPSVELKYRYPRAGEDTELQRKLRAQEQRCLEVADLLITPSRVTAAYLRSRGAAVERIRVIPNGVETEVFDYHAPRSLAPESLRLLYAGTMSAWQGVHVAIDALALLRRDLPATLVLAGPLRAPERDRLERHCERRGVGGAVELTGPLSREQLARLYTTCDIALAPLLPDDRNLVQGCCPLKVLEAMAAGTPLVASDLPAVRELAEPDEHALLVRPASASGIREAVVRLLDEPCLGPRLSAAARARVEAHFTWQRAQTELVTVYAELFNPSRATTPASTVRSAAG